MKVISIWGANGVGKSLVSISIAHYITNYTKKNTIIISADRTSPMFSTYLPKKEFNKEYSLGKFLDNEITKDNLIHKIHRHDENKFLAFMSMGDGDNWQRYSNNWSVTKMKSMIGLLSDYADYLILDLTSNFIIDNFTLFGLENADCVVDVYQAENKSTSFFYSYGTLLLDDDRYSKQKHIKVLNNYYDYSAYKSYMEDFDIKYCLPNCQQVYERFISGEANIFHLSTKKLNEFKNTIQNIIKEVNE